MTCSHCQGADKFFDRKQAESDLRVYQRRGAVGMTKRLLDTLKSKHIAGMSLLDVGGGIGVIQHEMQAAGVTSITDVDASSAYLQLARQEAQKRGYAAQYVHGDFVAQAEEIAPADIVTMDRVICCYPDVEALVNTAASKAQRFLGVIYPRDKWWITLSRPVCNGFLRLQSNPFRIFIHPTATVERITAENGLHKIAQHDGWLWQMVVYAR